MTVLSCNNLSVGYNGHAVASGITFEVNKGDMLCIVGENGSGKSTLVRTLLGLADPLEGTVSLEGCDEPGGVGYLPQRSDAQSDFPASAWEITLSGRLPRAGMRPFYTKDDRRAAQAALERVGAVHLRNKPFRVLSGGQQQRVLLARALCAASSLLVLDEPTTGLDAQSAQMLYETFGQLRAEGMALVAVTHDLAEAAGHASCVLELGPGQPVFMDAATWARKLRSA